MALALLEAHIRTSLEFGDWTDVLPQIDTSEFGDWTNIIPQIDTSKS